MVDCSVPGCQKPAHSRTYCHMHYRRWNVNGDLLGGRLPDWGKKGRHPLYHRWGQVKKKIPRTHPWFNLWTFINDVGIPKKGGFNLHPIDKTETIGKDNFYWKEKIPCKDKAKYAREWRRANPDKARNNDLKKRFGITLEEYNQILKEQNGVCAICTKICANWNNLAVDHCHATHKVRGLLCQRCNQGIGMFREDKEILSNAIKYLKKNG